MHINAGRLAAEIQDSIASVGCNPSCCEERFAIHAAPGFQVQVVVTSDPADYLDVIAEIVTDGEDDNE